MGTKETGVNRNVVPSEIWEDATYLMDCKEIKRNNVTRSRHNTITHKYNTLTPSNLFWPCDEKTETRTSSVNLNVEGKGSRGKREKMLDGLTKWLKLGRVTEEALKATSVRNA